MHPKIEKLLTQVRSLNAQWTELYKQWLARGLPIDVRYPRLLESTMEEFSLRVMSGLALVEGLERGDAEAELLLLHRVDTVSKHLTSAAAALTSLLSQVTARPEAELRAGDATLDTLKVLVNASHVDNLGVGGNFDQLSAGIGGVIDFAFLGLRTRKVQSIGQFAEVTHSLLKHAAEADVRAREIQQSLVSVNAVVDEVQKAQTAANELVEETEKAASDAATARDSASVAQSEAEAKLATIREVSKAAGSLDTQVQAYASNFEGFQKALDTRVAQHEAFEKNADFALKRNAERENEIDRLVKKSEDMIKGATTAGLGHSLEQTRLVYERKMDGARNAFKWSIVALVASATPLLIHLFPGLFGAWLGARPAVVPGEIFNSGVALELLGKMFLLFPATWLTQFFSRSYSEFFHLEREYAHKAALARAVEGFKKEAPKYADEITTAVFLEVQANPSKQAAPDAAEHPILGPVLRKFMDALPLPGKEKKKED